MTRSRHAARRGLRVRAVVVVVVIVGLGAAGAAVAHWSSAGTGSGAGATATGAQALSLTPAASSAQLYPGGDADVRLSIANPNSGAVQLSSLALDTDQGTGGFAVDGGHSTCAVSTLAFTTQDNGGAGWSVPGGDSLDVTLDGALAMAENAAQACQGATFTVYLEVGP